MAAYNECGVPPIQAVPTQQLSILDIFFPGLTGISTAAQHLIAGNLSSYTQLLCICGLLVFISGSASELLFRVVHWVSLYFTATMHVPNNDEAYDMLLGWIVMQPFADKARSSLASVRPRRQRNAEQVTDMAKNLCFSPWNGSLVFWYKGWPIMFRCREKFDTFSMGEDVSISCLGWSPAILRELLKECRETYLTHLHNKTSVFEYRRRGWQRLIARDVRPLETVVMSKKTKGELLADIEGFLDQRSRLWFANRGIPYRRGYLLYGPPGTGKSSLSSSIAGHFRLDIYIISLSNISEDELQMAFAALPGKCVVLVEDVDAVSTGESRAGKEEQKMGMMGMMSRGKVSLSALLNVLDGVTSPEGRVLVMTTNHLEKLDGALIRPGRVDRKIEFQLVDREMLTELFHIVYRLSDDDVGDEKERAQANEAAERLAKDFADLVPEFEFSPAEVMSFLVANKEKPSMALENVRQWIDRTREERIQANKFTTTASQAFD